MNMQKITNSKGFPFGKVEITISDLLEFLTLDLKPEKQNQEIRNFIKSLSSGYCDLDTLGGQKAYNILQNQKEKEERYKTNGAKNILKRWGKNGTTRN